METIRTMIAETLRFILAVVDLIANFLIGAIQLFVDFFRSLVGLLV